MMPLSPLVLASHNKGKLKEFGELLAPLNMEVISAASLGLPEPEETGATFHENATLKARAAADASGKAALSDDSGLVVPTLGGAPGIYSARWAGPDKDFSVAFARIERELAEAGASRNPEAYFVCVLCLALPNGETHCFEGRVYGNLNFPPRGPDGFGYDPIFIPQGHTRSFAEMSSQEKHALSHRAKALAQLIDFLHART